MQSRCDRREGSLVGRRHCAIQVQERRRQLPLSARSTHGAGHGAVPKIDWLEVTWPKPSGKVQRILNPPMDRYMTIKEE